MMRRKGVGGRSAFSFQSHPSPSPLSFPAKGKVVADVPRVPEAELEAFKTDYVDNSYIHDYDSPEAKERMSSIPAVRDCQVRENQDRNENRRRLSLDSELNEAQFLQGLH